MVLSKKIRVSEETREDLKELGRKGESYDSVIRGLLDNVMSLIDAQKEIAELAERIHALEAKPKEAKA